MDDPTGAKVDQFAREQLERAQGRLADAVARRDESRAECGRLESLVEQLEVEVAGWQSRVDD